MKKQPNPPKKNTKTIYTSNPNDPRIKKYNDSLILYNKGEQDKQKYKNVVKNAGLREDRIYSEPPNINKSSKIKPIEQLSLESKGAKFDFKGKKSYTIYEKKSGGSVEINDASQLGKYLNDRSPVVYKKPVQPVVYKKGYSAAKPAAKPVAKPTVKPAVKPTAKPTAKPTVKPTVKPAKTVKVDSMTEREIVERKKSFESKTGKPYKSNDQTYNNLEKKIRKKTNC